MACKSTVKKIVLKSDSALENKFEELTKRALKDSIIIFRLDTLSNFSWDTVFILGPYFPIANLEKEINIDLTAIKNTGITSDEVSNVLAFVKTGQLINYVDLPRNKGDFSFGTDSNKIFTNNNCTFELVRTNNKFASGETIIRVKPL